MTRKIKVIETTVIKTGQSSSGTPWALLEVTAVNEDDAPIEQKLKTFDDLKPGQSYDVDVERQDDAKFGTSFMLKLPRGSSGANPPPAGARLGPKVDEVRERADALEARVAALEARVTQLETGVGPTPARPAPTPATAPAGGATF